ncbi:hypothetical protein M0812_26127 [Anaeramoeba flamelloides]|uniref:Uncharacterized protein n=1 Tax=Anaeramoeba flamelloides TaxID=1746091 RepID=A0AAV7YCD7_9EUKA|nr:hypothetical protein M0812_26127 [Anaeramoeba flamelloides]
MYANLHLTSTNEVKFCFSKSFVHFNNEQWSYQSINLRGSWVKKKVYLRVSTTQKPIQEDVLPTVSEYYNINIIKSSIQKCVRRRLAESVVRLSVQMMVQDFDSFIRRLPIILVEDSVLDHCGYSFLVWMMVATCNGWKPTRAQILRILEITYLAALSGYHDHLNFEWDQKFIQALIVKQLTNDEEEIEKEKNTKENDPIESKWTLNSQQQTLVGTLLIRAAYGGMEGDQNMLMGAIVTWYNRLKNYQESWYKFLGSQYSLGCSERILSIIPLFPEETQIQNKLCPNSSDTKLQTNLISSNGKIAFKKILTPWDKFKEAIDYHCVGQLINKLKLRIYNKFNEQQLRTAIWYHRSGIYNKQYVVDRKNVFNSPNFPKNKDQQIIEKKKITLECWNYIESHLEDIIDNSSWWKQANFYKKENWEKNKRKRSRFDPNQSKITDFFKTKTQEQQQSDQVGKNENNKKLLTSPTQSNKLFYRDIKIKRIHQKKVQSPLKSNSINNKISLSQPVYDYISAPPLYSKFIPASQIIKHVLSPEKNKSLKKN